MDGGKHHKTSELTLEMDGRRITSSRFRKGVNAFLDLVEEVTKEFSGKSRGVDWIVSVSAGSARISVKPEQVELAESELPHLLDVIEGGLGIVEAGAERPGYFNDKALADARTLAAVVDEDELNTVRIWRNGKAGRVTSRTIANVDSILGTESKDRGSVEGKLLGLLDHKGCRIWVVDPINDRHVECVFSDEIPDSVISAFRKRVSVSGLISYGRNGEKKKIQVENFDVFPETHELPSFMDVYGILRDDG